MFRALQKLTAQFKSETRHEQSLRIALCRHYGEASNLERHYARLESPAYLRRKSQVR